MEKKVLLILVWSLLSGSLYSQEGTPAFPTAEGYGKWVSGGRGGKVIHVTNLEDMNRFGQTTPGSLRAALSTPGSDPITIVFDTSGIIQLAAELRIKRSNVTIAGQLAPGDGICIRGGSVNLGGSENLIIRHIRFRLGLGSNNNFLPGACLNIENAGSFIIDHCSFSWSAEENIGVYNNQPFTIQWCISAEGLYDAGHGKGARGYGAVLGGEKATYHHNLLAHNNSRSPRFGTSDKNDRHVLIEYINNVNFNWGGANSTYGGENELGEAGSVSINFVNNYYKPGPAYPGTKKSNFVRPSYEVGIQGTYYTKWHVAGNIIEGEANQALNSDNWLGVDLGEYKDNVPEVTKEDLMADMHEVPYPIEIETAEEAYARVIDNSGAFPRDAFDARIISELKSGTATASGSWGGGGPYGIVDKPSDSGGYPTYSTYNIIEDQDGDGMGDYWEMANNLDPTDPEDRNQTSVEGYTFLEVYLNGLVGELTEGFVFPDPVYVEPETPLGVKSLKNQLQTHLNGNELAFSFAGNKYIKVSIYSLTGQPIIRRSIFADQSINLSGLTDGIYILLVESGPDIYRMKFKK